MVPLAPTILQAQANKTHHGPNQPAQVVMHPHPQRRRRRGTPWSPTQMKTCRKAVEPLPPNRGEGGPHS